MVEELSSQDRWAKGWVTYQLLPEEQSCPGLLASSIVKEAR